LEGLHDLCHDIADSYTQRGWYALGYRSWAQICDAESSCAKLRLPDGDRRWLIRSLRNAGAELTDDERREVGGHITWLRMLIGDEETFDDEWNVPATTATAAEDGQPAGKRKPLPRGGGGT
jgi:hypothetical protein